MYHACALVRVYPISYSYVLTLSTSFCVSIRPCVSLHNTGARGNYVFKEGMESLLHGKGGASEGASGGIKRERDPNAIFAPRKTKVQTAMSVFSKDSRIACEKLLVARPEYQAVSAEERKQLLKDAVQAAFEALSEKSLADYTAKADAQNAQNQEQYAKAMLVYDSQMKERSGGGGEQSSKKLKSDEAAPAAAGAGFSPAPQQAMDVEQL